MCEISRNKMRTQKLLQPLWLFCFWHSSCSSRKLLRGFLNVFNHKDDMKSNMPTHQSIPNTSWCLKLISKQQKESDMFWRNNFFAHAQLRAVLADKHWHILTVTSYQSKNWSQRQQESGRVNISKQKEEGKITTGLWWRLIDALKCSSGYCHMPESSELCKSNYWLHLWYVFC